MNPRVLGEIQIGADELVILTKPDCPKCEAIEKILLERGIGHRKLRFSSVEARQLLSRHGLALSGVPAVFFRGQLFDSVLKALSVRDGGEPPA